MDNFKKEIWSVFIITALLGVFFQINRMDVFCILIPGRIIFRQEISGSLWGIQRMPRRIIC